jgi:hypothetical protein
VAHCSARTGPAIVWSAAHAARITYVLAVIFSLLHS